MEVFLRNWRNGNKHKSEIELQQEALNAFDSRVCENEREQKSPDIEPKKIISAHTRLVWIFDWREHYEDKIRKKKNVWLARFSPVAPTFHLWLRMAKSHKKEKLIWTFEENQAWRRPHSLPCCMNSWSYSGQDVKRILFLLSTACEICALHGAARWNPRVKSWDKLQKGIYSEAFRVIIMTHH